MLTYHLTDKSTAEMIFQTSGSPGFDLRSAFLFKKDAHICRRDETIMNVVNDDAVFGCQGRRVPESESESHAGTLKNQSLIHALMYMFSMNMY